MEKEIKTWIYAGYAVLVVLVTLSMSKQDFHDQKTLTETAQIRTEIQVLSAKIDSLSLQKQAQK